MTEAGKTLRLNVNVWRGNLDSIDEMTRFVDYAELEVHGQRVILKYARVEDKYDRDTVIPTLKLYPNGCLSNEWSFRRDIRARLSDVQMHAKGGSTGTWLEKEE